MAGYEYFQLEMQIDALRREVNNLKFKLAVLEKAVLLEQDELDEDIKQIIGDV